VTERVWRVFRPYLAIVASVPRLFLAYRAWVWLEFFVQVIALTVFVFFWRAVYAGRSSLGGLTQAETINYILLAQVMAPVVMESLVFTFGGLLREGGMAVELLRPLDVQARFYVEQLSSLGLSLVLKIPLAVFAWLAFGLHLPRDPLIWLAFLLTLVLGHAVVFCFDWLFACLAFYTTETWGLGMVRQSIGVFFSGALIPLALMPEWLRALCQSLPFVQALYFPVSLLSGITPLSEAPGLWLGQLAWLAGLLFVSRAAFGIAIRKVTVQGG
jgi:ABC-2 type transport system permease protein